MDRLISNAKKEEAYSIFRANPKSNIGEHGFTDEERAGVDNILTTGFVDTFRHFNPDKKDAYTWWSYMFNARENNAGWRIDYFCVSDILIDRLKDAEIYPEVMGSDHCPVSLIMD